MTIISNPNKEPTQNEPSDREIVETIATFMGYAQIGPSNFYPGRFRGNIKDPKGSYWIPDYLNSLDAMREVIEKLLSLGAAALWMEFLSRAIEKEGIFYPASVDLNVFEAHDFAMVHSNARWRALAAYRSIKIMEATQ